MFATGAGSTAADGTGRNGLFTSHLLNNLKTPGLEVTEVFRLTMGDVARASNNQQRPAVYNQFYGTAYLGTKPEANAPTPAPTVQPTSSFARDRIVDNAGLLGSGEKDTLRKMIAAIGTKYNFDLVIVTEKSIGNAKLMDYADAFFDNNGYGFGDKRDGCLLLLVIGDEKKGERYYWFSASGRGIGIFDSSAGHKLEDDVVDLLKKNNFFDASRIFVQDWEKFLRAYP